MTTVLETATAAMRSAVQGTAAPEPGETTTSTDPPPNASSPAAGGAELSDFIEVSGLLTYDPAAISRIYAGHPQRLLRRL